MVVHKLSVHRTHLVMSGVDCLRSLPQGSLSNEDREKIQKVQEFMPSVGRLTLTRKA